MNRQIGGLAVVVCVAAAASCGAPNVIDDKSNLKDIEVNADDVKELTDGIEDAVENAEVSFTMHHTRFDPDSGEFEELAAPGVKRNLFQRIVVDGRIYVLGGLDQSGNYTRAMEAWDPETEEWERLADRPSGGFSYDMAVGNLLCSVGGFKNLDEPIRREVECYDPETDEWTDRAQVPVKYAAFLPISHDGKVYILGGLDGGFKPLDQAYVYDPETDEWSAIASLPFGFSLGGSAVIEDSIYLVGGYKQQVDKNADDDAKDTDMLIYDTVADEWTTAPDMPHARLLYGSDGVDGKATVFFGISNGPLLEYFDPIAEEWHEGTDPPDPPKGGVYTYVQHDDAMYLFTVATSADASSVGASGELWRYDFEGDEWEVVGQRSPEEQDALFGGVSFEGGIHFVGAHTQISL